MKWPKLIRDLVALLKADTTLADLMGAANVYRIRNGAPVRIPGVAWFMVHDDEDENEETVQVQIDVWAKDEDTSTAMIERLLELFNHPDAPQTIGGEKMRTFWDGTTDLPEDDPGVIHRTMDFRFVLARDLVL